MSIYITGNHFWRQKWILSTGESGYFHTWHNTMDDAYEFVCNYIHGLSDPKPQQYYLPVSVPRLRAKNPNEPLATFIHCGSITLAPLS
jgi:hypothetical protein